MTSILTNASAMAALQTLRTIGASMAETQRHVSSGLRVQVAADNAAYWSISTTMRSDNKALSAVSDALGLGAAKIDVAYAGMEAAIETVSRIKAIVVAATDPALDRQKLQAEVSEHQDQLRQIANAASFSGENWLKAPLGAEDATQRKSVVASFVRSGDGNVAVKTVDYELTAKTTLFDTSPSVTGEHFGILDKVAGVVMTLPPPTMALSVTNYPLTLPTAAELIAEGAYHLSASGPYPESYSLSGQRYAPLRDATGTVQTNGSGEPLWIRIEPIHPGNIAYLISTGLNVQPYLDETGSHKIFDANMNFYSYPNPPTAGNLTVPTKSQKTLEALGFTKVGSTYSNGSKIYADATGADDWVEVSTTAPAGDTKNEFLSVGDGTIYYAIEVSIEEVEPRLVEFDFSLVTLNLTQTATIAANAGIDEVHILPAFLTWVEQQLQTLTSAASSLGALKARIDLQQGFAEALMDTINKGVGRLVDADMNAASTRLKALQTQEQLAIQSLSIANANAENIMQLFR